MFFFAAAAILALHRVATDLQPNLALPALDPVLFEQVLFNLLDNAAKYAPADTTITLRVRQHGDTVIEVLDEGAGLADPERIFAPFDRGGNIDGRPAGTGLGLAICRGFMTAMGGAITAASRTDRPGAVFTLTLKSPA